MDMAKEHAPAMLKVLVAIANSETESSSPRVAAATAVLDRGYGRPPQSLEHTGKDGAEHIKHDIRIVIVDPKAR
jgi:hypothetical protein